MSYATQADLSPGHLSAQELVQLTDDIASGKVNDTIVSQKLTEASALIDSYCRNRYTVPLQASEQIKGLTLTITVYLLFQRRHRVTDDAQRGYDNAISFLRDVSTGKAGLDQPTSAQPQAGNGESRPTDKEETFGDCNIKGYV